MPKKAAIERVDVDGESFMVCNACRYPTKMGESWSPIRAINVDGEPEFDPDHDKQTLCTECYLFQFVEEYPGVSLPNLPDGRLHDHGPVARMARAISDDLVAMDDDDFRVWESALERVRARGGKPNEVDAEYHLLKQDRMQVSGLEIVEQDRMQVSGLEIDEVYL